MGSMWDRRRERGERLNALLREWWQAYPGRLVVVAVLLVIPFISSVMFGFLMDLQGPAADVVSFAQILLILAAGAITLATWKEMTRRPSDRP